jgi:hypothetical protein
VNSSHQFDYSKQKLHAIYSKDILGQNSQPNHVQIEEVSS